MAVQLFDLKRSRRARSGSSLTTMTSAKQHDEEALLAILQSHGQHFIESFSNASFVQGSSKKRKLDPNADCESDEDSDADSGSDNEWEGLKDGEDATDSESEGEGSTYILLIIFDSVAKNFAVDDDDFTSEAVVKQPETIVFGEPKSSSSSGRMTKEQVKAFMVRSMKSAVEHRV